MFAGIDPLTIESGSSKTEILKLGAYIKNLIIDGVPILKPATDNFMVHGGCAALIPYAGRVRGGTYVYEGKTFNLPKDEEGNAIHGFLREIDLVVKEKTPNSLSLEAAISNSGYPTTLKVVIRYEIFEKAFAANSRITNVGKESAPLSVGFHPYFLAKNWEIVPDCEIRKFQMKDLYFPTGLEEPYSFETRGKGRNPSLDECLNFPCGATLKVDSHKILIRKNNMPYVVVYNGEWAEGKSVAFEPYTSVPDAFNNAIGLINLHPGESHDCGFDVRLIK